MYILILLSLFLAGCVDQKVEENKLRENIGKLLERYKQGINSLDQNIMESIISERFTFYDDTRASYVNKLFSATYLIDSISYSNIQVENYKIFADSIIHCTQIFKPTLHLPLFQDQIPYITGTLKKQTVFSFVYENEGLKIFAEDNLLTIKTFLWGENRPQIINPQLSIQEARPGNIIEVKFNVTKGDGNDVVFAAVNDVVMGSYSMTGYDEDNEVSYKLRVPENAKPGSSYEINLIAMGGKINLDNPQKAVLQGIAITGYSIPIR